MAEAVIETRIRCTMVQLAELKLMRATANILPYSVQFEREVYSN